MRDGAEGVGEAAISVEDAGAAVDVGGGAGFFGDAGKWDVFTFECALAIFVVRRVFGGIGEYDPFFVWSCWFRSQECLRPLALAE